MGSAWYDWRACRYLEWQVRETGEGVDEVGREQVTICDKKTKLLKDFKQETVWSNLGY